MLENLKDRFQSTQFGAAFLQLTPQARFSVISGGLLTIVLLGALTWWSSQPSYVVLAQDIEYRESAQLVEALSSAGIRHRVSAAGTRVEVDETAYAQARMALANAGVAESGNSPGLELFGSPHWGWTDFSEKVNYRRALEAEVERSVRRIAGVRSVKAHITLPESHPFRRSDREASASISVEMNAGVTLSPETVQGIKYLVSSSVERLSSDNVTVLDTRGRVLSPPAPDGPFALADRRREYQRTVERDISSKVRTLLTDLFGAGNVSVEVVADIDFDRVVRRSEAYSPDGQVILSEQTSEVEGTPGPPPISAASTATTNYQNPLAIEQVEKATGAIQRLSVAVLLNESIQTGEADEGADTPQIDLARIEELVRGAVGYNEARGDQVVVRTAPFGKEAGEVEQGIDFAGIAHRHSRTAISLLGLLLIFFYGRRYFKLLNAPAGKPAAADAGGDGYTDIVVASSSSEDEDDVEFADGPITEEQKRYRTTIQEARARGKKQPDAAARIVKAWLNED